MGSIIDTKEKKSMTGREWKDKDSCDRAGKEDEL